MYIANGSSHHVVLLSGSRQYYDAVFTIFFRFADVAESATTFRDFSIRHYFLNGRHMLLLAVMDLHRLFWLFCPLPMPIEGEI